MKLELKEKVRTNLSFDYNPEWNNSFELKLSSKTKSNPFLLGTGFILQGLKFNSAVDQFNAVAPFDIRGYKARDFDSYSFYIRTNRLLQQPISPIK